MSDLSVNYPSAIYINARGQKILVMTFKIIYSYRDSWNLKNLLLKIKAKHVTHNPQPTHNNSYTHTFLCLSEVM